MNNTTPDSIDQIVDAIEAGEVLDFIHAWLAQAPPAVVADLERYAWPYTLDQLRSDLAVLAMKLGGRAPTQPQP